MDDNCRNCGQSSNDSEYCEYCDSFEYCDHCIGDHIADYHPDKFEEWEKEQKNGGSYVQMENTKR